MSRDYSLLGKMTDLEVSKIWNCSEGTVQRIRTKEGISSVEKEYVISKRENAKVKQILEYLISHPYNVNVEEIRRNVVSFVYKKRISRPFIYKLAKENNIKITFFNVREDICEKSDRCKCNVCKFAKSIKMRIFRKYKKSIGFQYAKEFAIKYIDKLNNKNEYAAIFAEIEPQIQSHMFFTRERMEFPSQIMFF